MKKKLIQFLIIFNVLNSYCQDKKINYNNDLIIFDKLSNENLLIFNDSLDFNGLIQTEITYKFGKQVNGAKLLFKFNYLDNGKIIYTHDAIKHEYDGEGEENVNELYSSTYSQNIFFTRENKYDYLNPIINKLTNLNDEWSTDINDLYNFEYLKESMTRKYIYDKNNNLISIRIFNENGSDKEIVKIKYDEKNRVSKKIYLNNIDNENNTGNIYNICIYLYDKNSNIIKVLNTERGRSIELIYDNQDRIINISDLSVSWKYYTLQPNKGIIKDKSEINENYLDIKLSNKSTSYKHSFSKNYHYIKIKEYDNNGEVNPSQYILPKFLNLEKLKKYIEIFLNEEDGFPKEGKYMRVFGLNNYLLTE